MTVEFFQKPKAHLKGVISNIMMVLPVTSVLVAALLSLGWFVFGNFLGLPFQYYLLIPIIAGLQNLKAINLSVFRNLSKANEFGFLNISDTLFNLILSLVLVVGLGWDWEGRANAQIITATLTGIICFFLLRKEGYIGLGYNKSIATENFKFSTPLIPSIFAISIIMQVDRFFIKEISGETELGMYAIGTSFGMMITFILYSLEQIVVPTIYQKLSNKDNNYEQLVRFTKTYGVLSVLLAGILTAVSYLLFEFNFLPESYLPARRFIGWIAIAYALWGLCTIMTPYINFSKKTGFLLKATIVGCFVNLIGNYFLIHQFGAIGAAYSKVLTFGVILILYWYYGKRLMKINWFGEGTTMASSKEFLSFIK